MEKQQLYIKVMSVILLCFAASSCKKSPLVTDLDLSVGRLPQNLSITIDGDSSEHAWNNSAVMPFEEKGRAKFLWDDRLIYGSG